MQQQTTGGISFNVGNRYQVNKLVGSGAYGHVAVGYDKNKKGLKVNKRFMVAIKKLNKIEDDIDAKRVLREIKIQKLMKHPNILPIFNIVYDNTVVSHDFGDIYIVSPYYPADLSKIIKSGQELTVEHLQYIMYQLVKGLYFLHSASVIHRDIKPGNILATENCEIALCDFGFARKYDESEVLNEDQQMTEYVVTRYYRAPEVMLSSQQYSNKVDIWSLGCTFAELITGKVLFKGQNYIQMIKLIFDTLGKPNEDDLNEIINNENAKGFVDTLPNKPQQHISKVLKYESEKALDLLNKMLQVNPNKRLSSQQCLDHPFFQSIRDKKEEVTYKGTLQCEFELDENISLDSLKELILKEIDEIDVKKEMERIKEVSKMLEEEKKKLKQKKK